MLIVQKYGGTSVGDIQKIKTIAKEIVKNAQTGHKIVVVVSAMGGFTDELVDYSNSFKNVQNSLSADLLLSSGEQISSALMSMAINELACDNSPQKAISILGWQAGIITDENHTNAKIKQIDTTNIKGLLKEGYIVVVAGFQGITDKKHITTLGRGGSDLSAVALAGVLNADLCEIYTDVDGVYTADPRIIPNAKRIDKISYDEMLELASLGAKVLQNRSVDMAKKRNVNLIIKSAFNSTGGTCIIKEDYIVEDAVVSGIALDNDQAQISMVNVFDKPGIAADIFTVLADANINVDMIIQTVGHDKRTDLDFTIPKEDVEKTFALLSKFKSITEDIQVKQNISKVSIVGMGMKSHSGVASKAFKALAKEGVNIMMISTSEIKISVVVDSKYGKTCVKALHDIYNLSQSHK